MKLKRLFSFINLIMNLKKELSLSKPLLYSTQLPILSKHLTGQEMIDQIRITEKVHNSLFFLH